ncbi:anthranilate phosphoribosyltransferase [Kitasatospora sp. NPDC057904]|uniref:anthranilate phosphoribosyltransferase n=1 Tax=unclassified Kitasatospora TaxID=2633591 RepID=UPI0036D9A89D
MDDRTLTRSTATHTPDLTWPRLLATLAAGRDLRADEARWAMERVLDDDFRPEQLAGFLMGLRVKGESAAELSGLVAAALDHAVPLDVDGGRCVDLAGTGGDGGSTVNISTMASVLVAACGVPVVKHGGRSASSKCGTADVLEALGIPLDLPPAAVAEVARRAGITFCFAPVFHPALRNAAPVRRALGVPSAFNLLGPLIGPARPRHQVVGVADLRAAPAIAGLLAERGTSALVVRSEDGTDELTTTAPARIWAVQDGTVTEERLDPAGLGLAPAPAGALVGGGPEHNARVLREVLAGATGPVLDTVLLNAAAALIAARPRPGRVVPRFPAALHEARQAVESGAAPKALDGWLTAVRDVRTAG